MLLAHFNIGGTQIPTLPQIGFEPMCAFADEGQRKIGCGLKKVTRGRGKQLHTWYILAQRSEREKGDH